MYVNRTAKNNPEKTFFELLQIRILLTDDVIMTSQSLAMTTKVYQFYHTIDL